MKGRFLIESQRLISQGINALKPPWNLLKIFFTSSGLIFNIDNYFEKIRMDLLAVPLLVESEIFSSAGRQS